MTGTEPAQAARGRVLLTTEVPEQKTAWTKARRDVLALARRAGYATLALPATLSPGAWLRFLADLGRQVGRGGVVLLEYPLEQRRRLYPLYAHCRMRGVRLHGLIHDLNALRFEAPMAREMAILGLFDGLVSHNARMSQWLREAGYRRSLVDLQLFDYLLSDDATPRAWHQDSLGEGPLQVVCAGNLSYPKARYLYDPALADLAGVDLSLFGVFFEPDRMPASPVRHKGAFDPDTPALDARYHFGLVWDGESAQRCEGAYGRYMRYNNPHKVSLYAALGLPVVVWSEAAVARFVLDQGVGVAVGDLRELGQIRERLRPSDYVRMTHCMRRLQQQVTQGHFLAQALQAIEAG